MKMFAMTRAYFQQEHGLFLGTPLAAEIRSDDGSAMLLHFTSAVSMAGYVREMVPTQIEIDHGADEDVTELAAMLQAAWNAARGRKHLTLVT